MFTLITSEEERSISHLDHFGCISLKGMKLEDSVVVLIEFQCIRILFLNDR